MKTEKNRQINSRMFWKCHILASLHICRSDNENMPIAVAVDGRAHNNTFAETYEYDTDFPPV